MWSRAEAHSQGSDSYNTAVRRAYQTPPAKPMIPGSPSLRCDETVEGPGLLQKRIDSGRE